MIRERKIETEREKIGYKIFHGKHHGYREYEKSTFDDTFIKSKKYANKNKKIHIFLYKIEMIIFTHLRILELVDVHDHFVRDLVEIQPVHVDPSIGVYFIFHPSKSTKKLKPT
mgnify:CR=1 FL=1